MRKKGEASGLAVLLGIIVVLAVIGLATGNIQLGSTAPSEEDEPVTEQDVCLSTTSPSIDFICKDIENKGTSVSCGVNYRVDGGSIQYDTDGLNIGIDVGAEVEYLVNDTGWYSVQGELKVPCEEDPIVDIFMKDHAESATIQFYCEDDGLLNSNTQTEAITSTQTPKILTKILGASEDFIQDPVLICEYDKTYYDTELFTAGTYSKVSTPSHFVPNSTTNDGDRAWSLSADIEGNDILEFNTVFDSDDTNNAGDGMSPVCYVDDSEWYIDEDEGTFVYGASDENDADVGMNFKQVNATFHTASS